MEAISVVEVWSLTSGQGSGCNLSGHYTHYVPTDFRPTISNTDPPGKTTFTFTYNTFVPWVWFCLGDYFAGDSLSVYKCLMLPSIRDRETVKTLGQRPVILLLSYRGKVRVAVHMRPLGTLSRVISKVQCCNPSPSYAQGNLVSDFMAQCLD